MKQIVLKSPAKLNLYLEVLGLRKDGFHNLKTLFEKISLYDEISLRCRYDNKIRIISKNFRISQKANIVYKAASLLREDLGINKGVDIAIRKNIPVAAGLGGGSSNAASVLLGLNRLWNLKLSRKKLLFYARQLGADVAFFIYEQPFAWGGSRGDLIKPLAAVKSTLWHVLVVPQIRIKTRLIYNEFDKIHSKRLIHSATSRITRSPSVSTLSILKQEKDDANVLTKRVVNVKIITSGLRLQDPAIIGKGLFNRLEEVSLKACPRIGRIKEELVNLGMRAISMSGKGPAVFGIVSSRKEGERVSRQLARKGLGEVFLVKTAR